MSQALDMSTRLVFKSKNEVDRMSRVVIITDPVTAVGFHTLGVEVLHFDNPARAIEEIKRVLQVGGVDVLVVNDDFLAGIDDRMKLRMKSSGSPAVVALPVARTAWAREKQKKILKELREREAGKGHHERAHHHEEMPHATTEVTCTVCGHKLVVGMRICDRCGSIQRPSRVKSDGDAEPLTDYCRICGVAIPAGKKLCAACAADKKKPLGASIILAIKATIKAFMRFMSRLLSRDRKD